MKASNVRIVVIVTFALALIGGAAAGLLAARLALPSFTSAGPSPALTLEDLHLSTDQRDRIRGIWQNVRDLSEDYYKQGRVLDENRDKQVQRLLTPQQMVDYQKIYDGYRDQYTLLMAKREKVVKDAIFQTKQLLSDSQRLKYEAILAGRLGESPDRHDSGQREPATPAQSRPADQAALLQP